MSSRLIPKHVLERIEKELAARVYPFPKTDVKQVNLNGSDVGYIYIIDPLDGNDGIKIGRTKNLHDRVNQHRKYWPHMKLCGFVRVLNCVEFERSVSSILSEFEVDLNWDAQGRPEDRQRERFSLTLEDWEKSVKKRLNKVLVRERFRSIKGLDASKPYAAYDQDEIDLYWAREKYGEEVSKFRVFLFEAFFPAEEARVA
ncbi:GIY-YIG nuclease family protein [Vibrio parahaemolyticus]|uniref:GIY-YIG nuclease family protein n=2 Tax=Vibrio TaxID=662 RepID=UPI0022B39E43|nr:GIY-YIG nuclease family protein [Vibrio parahaemolyticus]MCZ5870238.1 GIY-YIG nuclease family protein [Vibrio parahaemolyticus]MCZ5900554.1 GIY-YIG nuclease family protein [Vibrio parahaemolyticus]MCZ6308878.1 GIY-YIG nuclease family protein [Vibrio parahaemolyticus]